MTAPPSRLSGTQLPDGGYVGKISAVAAADGVVGPNQPWPHKHCFRDREVQWRT